jgi:hypothetical protein
VTKDEARIMDRWRGEMEQPGHGVKTHSSHAGKIAGSPYPTICVPVMKSFLMHNRPTTRFRVDSKYQVARIC